MIRFLIAYLLIYGTVHAAFFHRLRLSFAFRGWVSAAIVIFLILMVLSPMFSRMLEARNHDPSARIVAHVGYYWMGFIFYAFLGSMCFYLIDLFSWAMSLFHITLPLVPKKAQMLGLMGLVVILMVYGYVEATRLRIERVELTTDKLPLHLQSFRIVQISDVHLGIINRGKFLNQVIRKIKALSPDLFVCTGDLVDGSMTNLMHLADALKKIDAPYGKFAVTGNHEYYAGLDHAIEFMQAADMEILRQEVKTIKNVINIAGVDDGGRFRKIDACKTLSGIDNGLFTLYLVHRPDISKAIRGLYDLQLCGHTHNGQMFPFTYLVGLEFPLQKGMHAFEEGSKLYISRGTGTWGPPLRILSPPEISVFEIKRK